MLDVVHDGSKQASGYSKKTPFLVTEKRRLEGQGGIDVDKAGEVDISTM